MNPARTAASAAKPAPYAASEPQFWAVVDGYEYALHHPRKVSEGWVAAVRVAAAAAWRVFAKIAAIAPFLGVDALAEMGFPNAAVALLGSTLQGVPTLFGRFDFVETANGLRLVELNAETPFFWMETLRMNGLACAPHGLRDPNEDCEGLVISTMRAAAKRLPRDATYAVTACNVYREDYWTARYLADLWERAIERPVTFAPVHELEVRAEGLFHGSTRIDVLHRCYPLEHLTADRGGAQLVELVRAGNVTLVNPGAALFLQNKLTQAVIWGLYERGAYFDEHERAAIERYFLPSYADEQQGGTWVRKPSFGREGSTISIIENGAVISEPASRAYAAQPMLHQQFASSEPVAIELSDGTRRSGFATVTCMIVDGKPGAVGMRVGDRITDGWAHFQPLALAN